MSSWSWSCGVRSGLAVHLGHVHRFRRSSIAGAPPSAARRPRPTPASRERISPAAADAPSPRYIHDTSSSGNGREAARVAAAEGAAVPATTGADAAGADPAARTDSAGTTTGVETGVKPELTDASSDSATAGLEPTGPVVADTDGGLSVSATGAPSISPV